MSSKEEYAFALEDALSIYGIRTNPFPIDEVDDFYFATPEIAKQHDVLRNLVEYSDLLLVVSGVEGAGKSAFLRSFLLAPGERWRSCRIDANEDMGIESLVEALLAGFQIEARSEHSAGDESLLRAHLTEIRANGDIALVAVDDAHLLPQISLEYLLTLAERSADVELRLLLASEPAALGVSTADSKRVHVVVLKPFDAQQCADYVNTRLSRAGLVGDSPFDAEVVEAMHADSAGVPGSIHPLALHTLLANADTSHVRRRPSVSPRTLAYAAALILAVGAVALVMQPETAVEEATARDPAASGRIQGLSTPAAVSPSGGDPGAARAEAPTRRQSTGPLATPAPVRDTSRPVAASGVENDDAAPPEGAPGAAPAALAVAPAAQPDKRLALPDGDGSIIRLASNATPKSTLTPAVTTEARERDWLSRQNPSHYVLQLVGTRDAAAARGFLERHGLAGEGTWLATTHDGEPWYVVVYGAYPDRASARAAIERLPEPLRARAPWPRSVASLAESTR